MNHLKLIDTLPRVVGGGFLCRIWYTQTFKHHHGFKYFIHWIVYMYIKTAQIVKAGLNLSLVYLSLKSMNTSCSRFRSKLDLKFTEWFKILYMRTINECPRNKIVLCMAPITFGTHKKNNTRQNLRSTPFWSWIRYLADPAIYEYANSIKRLIVKWV